MRSIHRAALLVGTLGFASAVSALGPQDPAGQPTARLSGTVTDGATGAPVANVSLRLVSFEVMRVARSAVTDAEGRFTYDKLVPGRYQLTASAIGYVQQQYGQRADSEPGRPIDLGDGQHFEHADFSLVPQGALEGVLFDEFGDPAPGITVRVSRPAWAGGMRRLMPLSGRSPMSTTNDKGQFRIPHLAPGRYYVTALAGVFADPGATGGFAPTFYPGTTQVGAAQSVTVGPGQQVTGIDFTLEPVPTVSVSGKFIDENGAPVARADYFFMAHDSTGASALALVRGAADEAGLFELRNVPAGRFTIQAFGRPEGGGNLGRAPFGWATLTVDDRSLTNLEVRIMPGARARGRFVLEGDTRVALRPQQVRVSPRSIGFESSPISGGPPNIEVREDWTFEVSNMSGLRVVRADVASPAWGMKRVLWRGRDVTDTPLDFTAGDIDDLEVVLTTELSLLSGTVTDAAGAAVAECSIVVFAVDPARWTFPSRYIALARPNQAGQFRVSGLPPASYVAVALRSVEAGLHEDPEFLEGIRALGSLVNMLEGQTQAIDLKLSSR